MSRLLKFFKYYVPIGIKEQSIFYITKKCGLGIRNYTISFPNDVSQFFLSNCYVGTSNDAPDVPVVITEDGFLCEAVVMPSTPWTLELFKIFLGLFKFQAFDHLYMYVQLRLNMNDTVHMIKVTPIDADMLVHREHEILAFVIVQLSKELEDVKRTFTYHVNSSSSIAY